MVLDAKTVDETTDGGDMNSHVIKNVADPLSNHDVATKNYVDTNAFTIYGGVVSGDMKLNVGSDFVRSLGCNDLSAGKKFTLLLGSDKNILSRIPYQILDYQCLSR